MAAGLKLLVVEDDQDIRELLAEELESSGFDVETAADGQQALRRMKGRRQLPDVILSNFTMPGMDGMELLHEVRGDAQLPDIPFVVMTAGITPDRSFTDADAVLHKPLDIDEVIEVIERVHRRRLVREAPGKVDSYEIASHT